MQSVMVNIYVCVCRLSAGNRQTGLCVSSYSLSDIGQSENVKMRDLLLEIVSTDREILSSVFLQGIQLPAGEIWHDNPSRADITVLHPVNSQR